MANSESSTARAAFERGKHVGAAAIVALTSGGCVSAGATGPTYTGRAPRSDAVLRETARDVGCPLHEVRVVAETRRRFVNETAFRFVVEGCGERAGYVEECELMDAAPPGWWPIDGALACRYLLVTRVRLPDPRAPAPPAPTP